MKTTKEVTTDSLKELIIINNDRYEGYKTAADEINHGDLKSLFNNYSGQSRGFSMELRPYFPMTEESPEYDETKLSGKFYRAWMDVKSALSSKDRKPVLSSCEFGEDVAVKAYENVLNDEESHKLSPEVHLLLKRQYSEILAAHNKIKVLRDSEK